MSSSNKLQNMVIRATVLTVITLSITHLLITELAIISQHVNFKFWI